MYASGPFPQFGFLLLASEQKTFLFLQPHPLTSFTGRLNEATFCILWKLIFHKDIRRHANERGTKLRPVDLFKSLLLLGTCVFRKKKLNDVIANLKEA